MKRWVGVCIGILGVVVLFFTVAANRVPEKEQGGAISLGPGLLTSVPADISPIEVDLAPRQNEIIGEFSIDDAEVSVPLVYGYNEDFMTLTNDVLGLDSWGNFPGEAKRLYILGHRNLVFQNLKNTKIGDRMTITMPYGVFIYEVQTEPIIVDANDEEALDYYLNDRDSDTYPQTMRLQTCYPFAVGTPLNHRYIVDLVLVEQTLTP